MRQKKFRLEDIFRDKTERLRIETLLRTEDDTIAFYMPLEDKIHVFIDAWAQNNYELYKYFKNRLKIINISFEEFLIFSLNKTYLHELIHWADEEGRCGEYLTDKMAIKLSIPEPLKTLYLQMLEWQRIDMEREKNEQNHPNSG